MSEKMEKNNGYIQLKFGPRWRYIAVVRAFIQNFLAISFTDHSSAGKISMAASELLENAVKYATGEETEVSVALSAETKELIISVSNRSNKESITELKTLWETIMTGEPLEAYMSKMREAATRSDGKSQLGLARIRYETGSMMKLKIEGDMVTVELKYNKLA